MLGAFRSWEYLQKISASILTQRAIKDHVIGQFTNIDRGKSHTDPDKERDIATLEDWLRQGKAHVYQ